MVKIILFNALMLTFVTFSFAQQPATDLPFNVRLEKAEIKDLPALQSFSYATWQGKWLLVGGRKDGLHRRQPWASFNEEGQNSFLYVVDPVKNKVWKRSLTGLTVSIAEQLQSTNMQFVQIANRLILTGGYGYRKSKDDHITHPYLLVIKVDELVAAIIENKEMDNAFYQIKDTRMAVTGGRMGKAGDTLLLAGGQRFDGMYNPHGPNHGPGFSQQYSNEIRKFVVSFKDASPLITYYSATHDSINLHRRDYNLVPQIFPDGESGYTMFSGVFQYNADIPFTNAIDIAGGHYKVKDEFVQKLNHYHCAVLPVYAGKSADMYTVFFGGIAQHYPDTKGEIQENADVPFTKTIGIVTRNKEKFVENYLSTYMPGYLGAAAEFIFTPGITMYQEGIADMDALKKNSEVLVGYIVGGIKSSDKNIFLSNTGSESSAQSSIIKVYITIKK